MIVDTLIDYGARAGDRVLDAAEQVGPVLYAVPIVIFGVLIAVEGIRLVLAQRIRQTRVTFAVLPSSDFDPPAPAVQQWAGLLQQVPRVASRVLRPRVATGIRITLTTNDNGDGIHQVTVPALATQLVQGHSLIGVEFIPAEAPGRGASLTRSPVPREEQPVVSVLERVPIGVAADYQTGAGRAAADITTEMEALDPGGALYVERAYDGPERVVAGLNEEN